MSDRILCQVLLFLIVSASGLSSLRAQAESVFDKPNLVAWCIVPFDDRQRTPEERATMLEKLGIRRLAYDYRAEHIPTFDAELEALKKHDIELTAWWFPTALNEEAKLILDVLKRHNVQTQLWVTGGGEPTKNADEQAARVAAEAARILPIAQAAAQQGCTVGLYNHGGWFGEPENQIAIIEVLRKQDITNVGIVYNQHHGHAHVDRFAALLKLMQPYLSCLNLNGMVRDGDTQGLKIVPLGDGELDVALLKIVRDSGYTGPIGILNHTQENAEHRLLDNLEGLQWVLSQVNGKDPGPKPTYRSWKRPAAAPTSSVRPFLNGGVLLDGNAAYKQAPLIVTCQATLQHPDVFNILVASDTKASGDHWELFSWAGDGTFTVYMPGHTPDHVRSQKVITDGQPHQLEMIFEPGRVRLTVDGKEVADQKVERTQNPSVPGGLGIGRLVEGGIYCHGRIDSVEIHSGLEQVLDWNAPEPQAAAPVPVQPPHDPALITEALTAARTHGQPDQGAKVFASAKFACTGCHRIGEIGGTVGPELSVLAPKKTAEHLIESVLWPKHKVEPEYKAQLVLLQDGRVVQGYRTKELPEGFTLRITATNEEITLANADVEEAKEIGTLMPDGLAAAMSPQQRQDLFAFLIKLRDSQGDERTTWLNSVAQTLKQAQVHAPAQFAYEKGPLYPAHWPHAGEHVNRDRIYDFYLKEALHFRDVQPAPLLLPPFPGLDGGTQGHWGNQNEQTWADNRWNETKLGTHLGGVFHGDGKTVKRGICVRLGINGEMAACFDPETLSYPVIWKTKDQRYVTFSDVRHGFMHGLIMNGTPLQSEHSGPVFPILGKPVQPYKYLGYFRLGQRLAFAYRLGETVYLDVPGVDEKGNFERVTGPIETHLFSPYIGQSPKQWDWEWETAGTLGKGQIPFAVDTIPLPVDNPWKALMFCGGHDFLSDGSALVCTMQGDVWRASGLTPSLHKVTWTRFASGLHHALGMKIVRKPDGDEIYIQCRDQLTRLHDLNADGEADYYECFSHAFDTSPAGHDFICGLERDAEGRFYTASGNQGLVRISADGNQAEVLATGFRNPDGMGLTSHGLLTIPCSEGDWTPASMLCALPSPQPGSPAPYFGYPGIRNGEPPALPLVYLPRGVDNSAGGQIEITGEKWGPLAGNGNSVHTSFGQGTGYLLMHDTVKGQLQGAVMPLHTEFLSGAHRARFHPDGNLYVSGMAGWGNYNPADGSLQRVRYIQDSAPPLPIGFHVHENGVLIQLSQPLAADMVPAPGRCFAQCWNYRYSGAYGSPELSPSHPGTPGHDVLTIAGIYLLENRTALFVELPDLQPVNQLHLVLELGGPRPSELFCTVHALDAPLSTIPGYQPRQKTIAAHPILGDIALALRSIPNPWLKRNHQARKVTLETGSNLSFATRTLKAKAGEALAITLKNPDVVPHNWALLKPGSLQTVGEAANRLIADPEAVLRQYVPDLPEVLAYTDITPPGGEFTIWITAPQEPGRYPYLCTFPGHWMVMNGELIVE